MKCFVTYQSKTGNTEKIANVIFEELKSAEHDVRLLPLEETCLDDFEPDLFFVGFGVEKGFCPPIVGEFLRTLHNQKIALFGTVGLGGSEVYFQHIRDKVMQYVAKDNEIEGYFFCQGKMPMTVRKKYEAISNIYPHNEPVQLMLQNFDKALTHPDETDIKNAEDFALRMVNKLGKIHE
jgi:Flavodoxins